jgi:hypothetical protein
MFRALASMVRSSNLSADWIALRLPVIVMVLAATAIPVELRPQGRNALGYGIQATDVAANIAGYVPVGIVLGGLGAVRAVVIAALMATFAEASQFAMMYRDSSVTDVASNVIGAILGTVVVARSGIRSPGFRINSWRALGAAALAVVLVLGVWATSGDALNARGATSPGTLEAYWKLDENRGRVALDSSGHGLNGMFRNEPKRIAGVMGGAVTFDGATDYIDFGHSSAFRLLGSMTISAWIKSSSYPVDDAAIVSNLGGHYLGFQLDTTVDRGPRTIGFKLGDVCTNVMARYGATPLLLDTWYHVAGVYDAAAQTMNVYLNGELDNGFLLGSVSPTHRSSREAVYVGSRSDRSGFEFAGAIDDVRIYSFALTKAEIAADMRGMAVDDLPAPPATGTSLDRDRSGERRRDPYAACTWSSEFEDRKIPMAVAAFGVLIAVACVGLWPSAAQVIWLAVCFFAGFLLLRVSSPTLPALNLWTFPLTSLAGGASVAVSLRRRTDLAG